MKRTTKLMAILLAVLTVASSISIAAYDSVGEPVEGYDNYGYYVYYDFEDVSQYNSETSTALAANNSQNALGLACNPFGFLDGNQGSGWTASSAITETDEMGNTYLHREQTADGKGYDAIAVFSDANGYFLTEAIELSFKFRITNTGKMGDTYLPLVKVRRVDYSIDHVFAKEDGGIYVLISGEKKLVYTPTEEEKGKFLDISFIWYDTTATYSLYINGKPVAEGIRLSLVTKNNKGFDIRSSEYVKITYNDDFGVESYSLKDSSSSKRRALELLRRSSGTDAFTFDVDDILLKRAETAQGGTYYYQNSFDGLYEGLTATPDNGEFSSNGTYYYIGSDTSTDNFYVSGGVLNAGTKLVPESEEENAELKPSGGICFGFKDAIYQQFTQASMVIEFDVNAVPTHTTDVRNPLVSLHDHNSTNQYYMLYVGRDGSLYLEDNADTLVNGYRLNGKSWLHVAIALVKNETNAGKFRSFDQYSTASQNNQKYTIAYYINGTFVGARSVDFREWYKDGTKLRTSHNFDYKLEKFTVGGEVAALNLTDLVRVDGGKENHEIWKTKDGLFYYDVETVDGVQKSYTTMTLSDQRNGREDSLRFFSAQTFAGSIDNLKIYEGTMPESVYETLYSDNGGTLVNVDFGSFSWATGGTFSGQINEKSEKSHGVCVFNGMSTKNIVKNDGYSTLEMPTSESNWFDFFLPMYDSTVDTYASEFSFETKVKSFDLTEGYKLGLFNNRIQYSGEANKITGNLMTIDSDLNLYAANNTKLYTADGEQAKLDNENWNELRADVYVSKSAAGKEALLSYYLGDELLYLEDGTLAYHIDIASVTNVAESYWGSSNHRVRFTQVDANAEAKFDIEYIKLSKNSDGAKLVGLQKNALNGSVRFIAGIDSLHFSKVGFEIEIFEGGVSKGVQTVQTASVFEEISADDKPLTAEDVDYNYLAAVKIVNLPENIPANSYILVRSFATVKGEDGAEDEKIYDNWFKVVVSDDGYYFDTEFAS